MNCELAISSACNLVEAFQFYARKAAGYVNNKIAADGFYVTANIRKDCLTSTNCRKVIIDGVVCEIIFENMQGGVWLAKLKDYSAKKPTLRTT